MFLQSLKTMMSIIRWHLERLLEKFVVAMVLYSRVICILHMGHESENYKVIILIYHIKLTRKLVHSMGRKDGHIALIQSSFWNKK